MLRFFQNQNKHTLLKICGVTSINDAENLAKYGVDALGFNFWPNSKRYITPQNASIISTAIKGKIIRVGVFVNAEHADILELFKDDIIDIAQLHGDEDVNYCHAFAKSGLPFIKAIRVKNANSLENLTNYKAQAILLDAHAPIDYGGTGDSFDWDLAEAAVSEHPDLPIFLAGGINLHNASLATEQVKPYALDIASGAELSPGIKDFDKIAAIQHAIRIPH
jgi:phosphoribosylanthranilate isomerase